jgi:hypothetical protein
MSPRILLPPLALALAFAPVSFRAPAAAPAADFSVSNNGMTSYTINTATNPTLNLTRGQTYTFLISATGHPFWIKTVQSTGTGNAYNDGVTGNGIEGGILTFAVPLSAPSTLFYDCQFHASMTGTINVTGPTPVRPGTWGKLKTLFR